MLLRKQILLVFIDCATHCYHNCATAPRRHCAEKVLHVKEALRQEGIAPRRHCAKKALRQEGIASEAAQANKIYSYES
jgi:hypothetical protein